MYSQECDITTWLRIYTVKYFKRIRAFCWSRDIARLLMLL